MIINYTIEQRLQVRQNCVICYSKYIGKSSSHLAALRRLYLQQTKGFTYSGTVTKGAMKRITKCVNLLMMTTKERWIYSEVSQRKIKHKLSFVTLTISDNTNNITAKEAYEKLLEPFLAWLRKTKGVRSYIWKAELQKRGQIHYHITTPSFINWQEIRAKWNRLQMRAGLLDDYYNRFKSVDPNSTDIHQVYKKSDLTSYLIKYLSKSETDKGKTTGKIWDASINLKQSAYPDFEITNEQNSYLEHLQKQGWLRVKYATQCSIIKIPTIPGIELLCEPLYNNCLTYLNDIATSN